jgi:hypothetical protein
VLSSAGLPMFIVLETRTTSRPHADRIPAALHHLRRVRWIALGDGTQFTYPLTSIAVRLARW